MEHKKYWYKDMIMYQIYPRSFKDGNGDGIGDFRGMIEKLDYLKELGITAVWLSPVFASPNVDNGYDISDYRAIMEEFGTMEDWIEFRDGLHERGIAIVMDLVINHSSDLHEWFIESRKSKDNRYSDFYVWADPKPDGSEPNGWQSVWGGSAWEYVPERDQYYLHCFSKQQPDLNWDCPEAKKELFDMIRYWNDLGVDGYRVDAISYLDKGLDGRADPNVEAAVAAFVNLYGTHKHIRDMVEQTILPDNLFTIGEVNVNCPQDAWNYTAEERNEFQMAIAFVPPVVEIESWSPAKLKKDVQESYDLLAGKGWWARYFSNHDKPRQVSLYGNDREYWDKSAKMLACYLHTLPGSPIIYQGEEIGMTNIVLPSIEDYNDIETKNTYRSLIASGASHEDAFATALITSRDNARSPMQWSSSPFGGFTDSDSTWLKVNPNYVNINVEKQQTDENSILSFYKQLIRLRKENRIMAHGDYVQVSDNESDLIAYTRSLDGKTWLCLHNFSEDLIGISLKGITENTKIIISNYKEHTIRNNSVTLKAYESIVFEIV